MSGTSYPSPVSSPRSPILEDSQRAPSGVIPEPAMQEQVDTQRSLHQASAVLEAAYRRIRQARRNLLELTEMSPLQDAQTRMGELNDFNPGYDAITLTGEEFDTRSLEDNELELRRENTPPDTEARLRQYETIPALDFLDTDRSYDPVPSNSIGSLPFTPPSPHPPTVHLPPLSPYLPPGSFHPRRSQLDSQLARRRELLLNDPTTTIGRRVAAREAGSATPVPSLSPWNGASVRLIAAIERDMEQVRNVSRQRRTDPVRPEVQPMDAASRASRSLDINTFQRTIRNQTPQARATNSTSPLGLPVEPHRQRLGRGSAHPSPQSPTSNQSGRLSILSNLPVQNLTTPVSAVSRPLLFEEPSSYISAADVTRQYSNFRDEQNGPVGERSYVIRRTINADGEEHVHPISFEWSDEEASPWALPGGQRDELYVDYMSPPRPLRAPPVRYVQRSDTFQNPQTSGNLPSGAQRRRGWARLDPDGNEIPPDEEEELERVRAELRVNAQFPPRALVPPVDGVDIRPRLHPLHSNNTIPHEYESNPRTENPLRFGPDLRDGDTSWSYGNIQDLVPTVTRCAPLPLHQPLSQHSPFVANPLPMPLEDMVISSKRVQRDDRRRITRVARHASLAGR